jgi:hypothetical protein
MNRSRLAVAVALTALVVAAGLVIYRSINGYPGDHGLAQLSAEHDSYSPETWQCVIEIFQNKPISGTILGQFVVEPVYSEDAVFAGIKVDAAFGSQEFQIGDTNLIYYAFGEFRTYATLRDCSKPPFQ